MFGPKHYVPILKWKAAEKTSLKELQDECKTHITPVFQLVMPGLKRVKGKLVSETPEEQFEEVIQTFKEKIPEIPEEILDSWGTETAFIDLSLIYTVPLRIEGLRKIISKGSQLGIHLVPVLNLSDDPELKEAIFSLDREYKSGLCLRLVCSDFNDLPVLNARIRDFLMSNNLTEETIDLLVDIKDINGNNGKYSKYANLSQEIYNLTNWRTFTFASGAFPVDLTAYKIDEENIVPRLDWDNWIDQSRNKKLRRYPSFADYTIQHPIYKESSQFFSPSTSIKYTLENDWLIMKGKKGRFDLYLANAKLLSDDDRFFGESFSYGDKYIFEKAQHLEAYLKNPKIKGTGTSETWLSAGINHHLVCTVDLIANLS